MSPTSPESKPADPHGAASVDVGRDGVDDSYERLYEELRVLARRQLRSYRPGHTLGTTGLVHESYLKLVDLEGSRRRSRAQFFSLACRAMRHVLVDYERGRKSQKRGGGALRVTLHPEMAVAEEPTVDLLSLDDALAQLGGVSERMERIVECRFFGGLSVSETAEALGTSERTVEREWTRARAYLYHRLSTDRG
jgi:RNA polymerase sigma factor (TIGR02999 family)